MKIYGSEPIEIASDVIVDNSEMYFYQYLPIHLKETVRFAVPERLNNLRSIINLCCYDFGKNIDANLNGYYIYLTAKCLYVPSGENLNRFGWHCDGFMTEDINYIWCDCIPTEYVTGEFELVQDHEESIDQMNRLFYHSEPLKCKPNSIYRLDEKVIHRCDYNRSRNAILRHFVKVSFSKEKYNLKGNSHNYLLDYDWEMKERDAHRNHPVK
ncbi:hypothetical protein [Sphingobacterium lactis]|uniref:Phytanoyl-CoA dioxygenase (PhyH) n=1 Tax=Sphingobacterium lactis TaxID=797291 RepID=A0A1H6CS21_9SPHI|nr:hypothetical protein [Sphingobacterium lactis]SEG75577.1 hypothetical protein SAMN05421877_11928 [Sphingobacterium lactis]